MNAKFLDCGGPKLSRTDDGFRWVAETINFVFYIQMPGEKCSKLFKKYVYAMNFKTEFNVKKLTRYQNYS